MLILLRSRWSFLVRLSMASLSFEGQTSRPRRRFLVSAADGQSSRTAAYEWSGRRLRPSLLQAADEILFCSRWTQRQLQRRCVLPSPQHRQKRWAAVGDLAAMIIVGTCNREADAAAGGKAPGDRQK